MAAFDDLRDERDALDVLAHAYLKKSVTDKVKTPEGRALLGVLNSESIAPADKGKKLADEATGVGVAPCAFADWWQAVPVHSGR
jgi:hypothetical protein